MKATQRDTPALEMVPMVTSTHSDINIKIEKAFEEKGINHCAHLKYLKRKYGDISFNIC